MIAARIGMLLLVASSIAAACQSSAAPAASLQPEPVAAPPSLPPAAPGALPAAPTAPVQPGSSVSLFVNKDPQLVVPPLPAQPTSTAPALDPTPLAPVATPVESTPARPRRNLGAVHEDDSCHHDQEL
jgi:hypothetical protein